MPMSSREMIRLLQKNGFEIVSQNGSHVKMKNPQNGRQTIIPYHSKAMKKGLEQAIFHIAKEGGFWVSFPDIPECLTEGDNMQQAYEMASEALGLYLTAAEDAKEAIPEASFPQDIEPAEDGFLVVIEFDMMEYRKNTAQRQ